MTGNYKLIIREVIVKLKSDALNIGTVLRDLPSMYFERQNRNSMLI
jgi:hypothetical protein